MITEVQISNEKLMQERELNVKHLFLCYYYFQTVTKKEFFQCLFGHSLVTTLWLGGVIAVYSIKK